jgi:cytochrome c-type biogenesis protein CcmH/NrfF
VTLLAVTLGAASGASAERDTTSTAPPELEQRRSEPQTSVDSVGATVMCPSCDTTLDQSNSPAADRMRIWVETAVAAGWTEDEIRDGLVEEYGGDESVLAVPRAQGIGLAVWIVPALVVLGALVVGLLVLRSWRRTPTDQARSTSSSYSHAAASPFASSPSNPDSSGEPAEPSTSESR